MWLLDVETFSLVFFDSPPPRYAILSHTWGEDEVVFQDMEDIGAAQQKEGWMKIRFTCDEAKKSNLPYAWVDTCCIDKTSSTELSRAVNSMFEWYRRATCCYAYLADFKLDLENRIMSIDETEKELRKCRWFTRGWTLQELIAAPTVVFFGYTWNVIGTKDNLQHPLAEITGIDDKVLRHMVHMYHVPVGRRMSWAAKRQTTRIEDLAYCLLGIFNVNMPLLYGEGEKAFVRLQEEITTEHNDLSLFAWCQQGPCPKFRGMFAQSPAEFVECSSLVSGNTYFLPQATCSVTGEGLLLNGLVGWPSLLLDLKCLKGPRTSPEWMVITPPAKTGPALQTGTGMLPEIESIYKSNDIVLPDIHFHDEFRPGSGGSLMWWGSVDIKYEHGNLTLALICGVPENPEAPDRVLPWFALLCNLDGSELSELAAFVGSHPRVASSPEQQRRVSEAMFGTFADTSGIIRQEKLPTFVKFRGIDGAPHEVRLRILGGGDSVFCTEVQYH
ncbi:Fc.00g028510.m01.CDS01 [Cosmosporella sp. VM-42]